MVAGLATVFLLTIWTVVPRATWLGLPAGHTWRAIADALQRFPSDFQSSVAPASLTTGFELLVVCGVGLVALFGDWLAFRVGSGLQGAAPGAMLFVTCSVLGTISGRVTATVVEVAALLGFLLAHQSTVGQRPLPWFANRRHGARNWSAVVGLGVASVALLGGLVIVPVLPQSEGHGVLGWRGGFGGGGGFRQVSNPIVDLHARLIDESNTPVFTVESSVASYWRLTSLNTFTGQDWVSTNSYQGFHVRLPGVSAPQPGTQLVSEHFRIQQLQSVWLPAAFNPLSVQGGGRVSYDPVSGSLLTSHPTADGLDYQVTSLETLASLSPAKLEKAGPVSAAQLAPDLQLPANVPPQVRQLADSIVAGKTTEYDKAIALQNYFQGPLFHYSLNPPDTGYGMRSLTDFLFTTRTGFCQQFAGSYAVLARLVGLPTRLAYGFATGILVGGNTYQVTDADAHTWPEVYFPGIGWVPFEPTNGSVDPQAQSYSGGTGGTEAFNIPAVPFISSTPTSQKLSIHGAHPLGASSAQQSATSGTSDGGNGWIAFALVLAALALGAVGWVLAGVAARRVRWRRRRARAQRGEITEAEVLWGELAERFAWCGLRRRQDETFVEFAARADLRLRLYATSGVRPPSMRPLAVAMSAVVYAPATGELAGIGESQAREIGSILWNVGSWRRRLAWWTDPNLTWKPVTVTSASPDSWETRLQPA